MQVADRSDIVRIPYNTLPRGFGQRDKRYTNDGTVAMLKSNGLYIYVCMSHLRLRLH